MPAKRTTVTHKNANSPPSGQNQNPRQQVYHSTPNLNTTGLNHAQNPQLQKCISAGLNHTVGLMTCGTVIAAGLNTYRQFDTISSWKNVVAVSTSGEQVTAALISNGTVVVASQGQCDCSHWRDIVAISCVSGVYGLKHDGTIVAVGLNGGGLGMFRDENFNTSKWTEVVAISGHPNGLVGLKSNGTVVASAEDARFGGYMKWNDIIEVSASDHHLVGRRKNGTVVAGGILNSHGECNVGNWKDIVAISAGGYNNSVRGTGCFTIGLKSDGTVVAVGANQYGQCNVSHWRNIVAVSAGIFHTIGLKSDGTVVATGNTASNACAVSQWRNIGSAGSVSNNARKQQKLKDEQHFQTTRKLIAEQHKLEQSRQWKLQGLCSKCGGKMKGFFTKECENSCNY